jgi:hypothetical protein
MRRRASGLRLHRRHDLFEHDRMPQNNAPATATFGGIRSGGNRGIIASSVPSARRTIAASSAPILSLIAMRPPCILIAAGSDIPWVVLAWPTEMAAEPADLDLRAAALSHVSGLALLGGESVEWLRLRCHRLQPRSQ